MLCRRFWWRGGWWGGRRGGECFPYLGWRGEKADEFRNEFENSKEGRRLQMLRVVGDGRENVDEL